MNTTKWEETMEIPPDGALSAENSAHTSKDQ